MRNPPACVCARVSGVGHEGGQHQARVTPRCLAQHAVEPPCLQKLLAQGAYNSFAQSHVVQAQYFKVRAPDAQHLHAVTTVPQPLAQQTAAPLVLLLPPSCAFIAAAHSTVTALSVQRSCALAACFQAVLQDPDALDTYLQRSRFLADINNEVAARRRATYHDNLASLRRLVLFQFDSDEMGGFRARACASVCVVVGVRCGGKGLLG